MQPPSTAPGLPARGGEPVRIVPLGPQDAGRVIAVDQSAFFFDPESVQVERDTAHFDWPRTFAAVRAGQGSLSGHEPLAGLYTSYPMAVSAPGPLGGERPVPMAGLSWVSVHPDQRRRGVLRTMLQHHFAQLHEAGEHLGGLHAAEVPIYGRFGYAVASLSVSLTLSSGTTFTAPDLEEAVAALVTHFEPADSDDAARRIQQVHLRAAETTPGTVTRSEHYLRASLVDRPAWRRGREPKQVLFAGPPDGAAATGYAIFHRESRWEDNLPKGTLSVEEMAAVDPASLLALARRLVDFDLVTTTKLSMRSVDDPLVWWTGGPRGAELRVDDGLWLRLVDVGGALELRGYAAACDVVLDVVDGVCPWNQGRWRLEVDAAGAARCSRTEAEPHVRLPVQALAAAYLGSRALAAQSLQGSVQELVPGSLWPLSRALSSDREPVGPVEF